MAPCVPFKNKPEYMAAQETAKDIADLLSPQTGAYFDVWFDGEKAFSLPESEELVKLKEWARSNDHKTRGGKNRYPIYNWKESEAVTEARWADPSGKQNIDVDGEEPFYGKLYLPRKFKITVTVPGDNSVDFYVDDINLVCIMDEEDPKKVKGYNIAVGGGMGRTHGKEETMPFAAEHLGYVEAKDMLNVVKSILCVQRDHGRRDDRKMSRFKYVVHEYGIDKVRDLVEEYSTVKIQDWVPLPPWEYKAYLGWHEQGDGKWFLGLNIDTGRIKDDGDVRMKSALREIVGRY